MSALLPHLQKLCLLVFLLSSMVGLGLVMAPASIVAGFRDRVWILRVLVLNFVVAPGFAWVLSLLFRLQPDHTTGLLLLGCAAGAPFFPKLAAMARGDVALAASALVLLTVGTMVFLPLMLPRVAPGLHADLWAIARPLLWFMVLPAAVGLLLRSVRPCWATGLAAVTSKIANASLAGLFALVVVLGWKEVVSAFGTGAIAAVVVHATGLLLCGWWWGGNSAGRRPVLALGTAARNFAAAMIPASAPGAPAQTLSLLVVAAIVGLAVCFAGAFWARGRTAAK